MNTQDPVELRRLHKQHTKKRTAKTQGISELCNTHNEVETDKPKIFNYVECETIKNLMKNMKIEDYGHFADVLTEERLRKKRSIHKL